LQQRFDEPKWDGQALEGRAILLHAERGQGFGDMIQMVRYAAVVKKLNPAATVVMRCQRPLVRMLASCAGIDRLVADGDALPPFDVQSPLLSLPGIFGTEVKTIPADMPYVFAEQELVEEWRERLAEAGADAKDPHPNPLPVGEGSRSMRIGIQWHGRTTNGQRDIPLECFRSLTDLPGLHFISLQPSAKEELAAARQKGLNVVELGDDVDTAHGAFMDTAAIMMNLDLVISSDTSVAHLAGALGVAVWVALPFVPDWRWLLDRSDSPWYPTMRLFRQKSVGDWHRVFEDIRAALLTSKNMAG
jgi:hypothetical protein